MVLIPCGEQCIHQKDGCCSLQKPTAVTHPEAAEKGCLYFSPHKPPMAHLPTEPKGPDGL